MRRFMPDDDPTQPYPTADLDSQWTDEWEVIEQPNPFFRGALVATLLAIVVWGGIGIILALAMTR